MRIASFRAHGLPGIPPVDVELPGGLVALVVPDGRIRRGLARMLVDEDAATASVTLLPRAPDPVLGGLPENLLHRLRTGRAFDDADHVVEGATRALAWNDGLDRLESARARLARTRAADPASPDDEALLARIRHLEGTPEELAGLERELRDLRGDDVEVAGDLEQATMEWLRERQDAETRLQAYRDRARELRTRLQELAAGGGETDCPTCGRPLADHVEDVRAALEEEWEGVVQDGSWWRRRREQLEGKPERLQELERRAIRVHAATEELGERVEAIRTRVRELEDLRARLSTRGPSRADAAGEVSRAHWEAVDRALAGAARELRDGARTRLLDRASGFLARISAGRLLGLSWAEQGHVVLEGMDAPLHPPSEEDGAAAWVATRLAALELVWEETAAAGPGLLLGDAFDRMDESARVRAVDLLGERGRRSRYAQIVVLTRGDIVDLVPEAFDAVVEIRGDGSGVTRLPAGSGLLRLVSPGALAPAPVESTATAPPPSR